ncbi:MAG: winged helix-turn-helix domain-containing protein [Blastocatellia bacterium]|nr:winged helix-turn-helix domain-containing protein [Blastocatellia bacterium]
MPTPHNALYEFESFRLDAKNGLLWSDDEVIPLKPKAIALLHLLIQHPGVVLTKQEIIDALWPDTIVEEGNLTQTMHLLRKALSHDGTPQSLIETVPKIGYRWVGEVRVVAATQRLTNGTQTATAVALAPATPPTVEAVQSVETVEAVQPSKTVSASPASKPVVSQAWWRDRRAAWGMLGILVVMGLLAGTVLSRRSQGPLVSSIAVLPFGGVGMEATDPSLSLGLADALITRLSTQGNLEVLPTVAVARYSERKIEAIEVGKQLGVEAVLTGYIHHVGGRVRLTSQLVRVSNGQTLWAGTFDEDPTNLFVLEDALTLQVTSALRLPRDESPHDPVKDYGTDNLEAWQLYQKGRYLWNKRQWTETKKAIVMFEQALQLDPDYSQAYAGLADCYALWNPEMKPRERLAKAKPAAERALTLNDRLADAHASLGFIKYKFEWDWRGAEVEFKRALALNPNYATAHHWYGESLSLQLRHAEALTQLQAAERLNPLSFPIKEDIGLAFYRARDFANAERKFREVLELDPNFFRTHHKLSDLLQDQGRYAEAFRENLTFWKGIKVAPEIVVALQQAYEQSGWQACARAELELIATGKLADDAHRRARLSLRAGDREQALQWLMQSFDELGEAPLRIKEPEFDPLLNEPRFKALLQRAGHAL